MLDYNAFYFCVFFSLFSRIVTQEIVHTSVCILAAIKVWRQYCRRGFEHPLMELSGEFLEITTNRSKCRTRIAQKLPLVYTYDKSYTGEREYPSKIACVTVKALGFVKVKSMKINRKRKTASNYSPKRR